MKTNCESCNKSLQPNSLEAFTCKYEDTPIMWRILPCLSLAWSMLGNRTRVFRWTKSRHKLNGRIFSTLIGIYMIDTPTALKVFVLPLCLLFHVN